MPDAAEPADPATAVSGTPQAQAEAAAISGVPHQLLIGGTWRGARSGATLAVEDPATEVTLCHVADAGVDDGLAALAAAAAAQGSWAATPPRRRGDILRRAYETMVERADQLALLVTLEMGKSVRESRGEVLYAADFLRWFSEEAVRIEGHYGPSPAGGGRLMVMNQPVGPCVLVTPWNFPIAMGARKIGPAIAAGCTMVIKPAEQTPLSTLALASILEESGLPPGVLNVITTSSPGAVVSALLADPRTRKLSFTGSTEVGRQLAAQAAPNVLRTSLELGGNAPFIVFADADLEAAVEGAMTAKMRNIGQACTAANRFLVARELAEDFAELLATRMSALRLGRGTEPDTDLGPLIDEAGLAKVVELVEDAMRRGARRLIGGHRLDGPGHFHPATVLLDVPTGSRVLREEVFGPVAPISTFASEAEGVAAANDTEFGLVAYLYTRDLGRALRTIEALEVGMVGVNQGMVSNAAAPFGGVKQSGYGREGGREGIREYLRVKYAAIGL